MLEIPGEEAPTDPGAQMRARLAAEERLRARTKRKQKIAITALAGMVMVVAGIAVTAWLQARQAAITYDLPDDYYQPTPLEQTQAVAQVTPPEGDANGAAKVPKKGEAGASEGTRLALPELDIGPSGSPSTGQSGSNNAGAVATTAGGTDTRAAAARPRDTPDAAAPQLAIKTGENGIPTIAAARVDGGFNRLLSDDAEIFEMAKSVVEKYRPQLNGCFESATRSAPDLRGSWTVSFTIEPSGTTKNVSVKAAGRTDANFEQCAANRISQWKFLKIDHDFNVRKKYNFDPQG